MRKRKQSIEERCITAINELDYLEELEILEKAVLENDYQTIEDIIRNLKELFNQN